MKFAATKWNVSTDKRYNLLRWDSSTGLKVEIDRNENISKIVCTRVSTNQKSPIVESEDLFLLVRLRMLRYESKDVPGPHIGYKDSCGHTLTVLTHGTYPLIDRVESLVIDL